MSRESDTTSPRDIAELEREVESLAGELAALINAATGEGRETLRELALTIVREEVRTAEQQAEIVAAHSPDTDAAKRQQNPLAMAIPLFMMGCVTIFLFPPVGLILFLLSGVLVVIGIATSMFTRSKQS